MIHILRNLFHTIYLKQIIHSSFKWNIIAKVCFSTVGFKVFIPNSTTTQSKISNSKLA